MPNTLHPARPNARRSRSLTLALATGLALALAAPGLAVAAEQPAEDTLGISAEPLNEGAAERTRFSYQMSPGQSLEDAYVVTNSGTTAQTYTVFATDAFNTDDGGYGLLDTGIVPSAAGSWLSFADGASTTLALEPGQTMSVPFTVRVPDNAGPGDHAGGLVVSATSQDGQVLVDRRIGTRLYIRVPGELQPALTIAGMSASYTPSLNPFAGETTVTYTVRNSGNIALSGELKTEVRGLFGIGLSAPVQGELSEMLPGSTRTVTTTVAGVGQWLYLNPLVTLYPEVDAEAMNPGTLLSVNRDTVLFVVPWVLLIVVLLAAATWGWIVLRRRRDGRRAEEWIAYTEAEARRKADHEREPVGAGADRAAE